MSITAPQPAQPRPQQPQRPPGAAGGGGTYNAQLHPRGRGGKWIVTKGAGYGAGGPDQTTLQLQQRLQQLGFTVPHDGKYGPQTEIAVKAFQQRYGLSTTGGIDPATMEVLQNPPGQSLAQIQAARKAALSASARKRATTSAKAKSTARTKRVRASAHAGGTGRSGASTPSPGLAPGTSTAVVGVGHMGTANLIQGAGMTGSSNPAVTNLQAALTQAGFTLNKDGRFGPKTEAAVKQLQTKYGLKADGSVGPATKALLLGLESSTPKAAKKVSRSAASKAVPGQPVTLRTQTTHPRHGSRTAGSRMKLKGPKAAGPVLKYSASDLPDPDLEEGTWIGGNKTANTSTVAFGVGGEPSMSIKDARPAPEPTPMADLPVWDRMQRIANPPDRTIPDGRDVASQAGARAGRTLIDDGRDQTVDVMALLQEAIAERKAATDGRTFARALARERILRERLQESLGHSVPKAVRGYFDPHDTLPQPRRSGVPHPFSEVEHPRGRGGKWVDVLAKLKGLKPNKPGKVEGIKAMRLTNGYYTAALPGGHVISESAEHVADAIVSQLEEAIGPIAKGAFHAWLGKKPEEPITAADIAKGKAAGGHPAKMAHFAEQAKGWGSGGKKKKALKESEWLDEHAEEWLPTQLQESEKTAGYAVTPHPFGKPGGPGLWKHKGLQLPPYIQNVAHGIQKSGKSESQAIAMAIGTVKRWARGGGKVSAEVKAAAAAALAQWEALKASHGGGKAKK